MFILPNLVLYLLTLGLFGLGWLYDLWTLNDQIDEINYRERKECGYARRRAYG